MASDSVWVTPCRLPANMIVAPNSPIPRANASAARAGRVEHRVVERLERGDRLAQVEGARDVGDGEHDGRLREADRDPERLEGAAEEPEASERGEERDPRDGRREDQRKLDERDHELAPAEPPRQRI